MRKTLFLLALLGCDGSTEPQVGTLQVIVSTLGGDPDLDGYQLRVDDRAPESIGIFASIRIPQYPTGEHTLTLEGIAENCELSTPTQVVVVHPEEVTRVRFEVTCYATGVTVIAETVGLDFDADGYEITVNEERTVVIGAIGAVQIGRLTPGASYTLRVSHVAANCTITEGDTRTPQIVHRQLTLVTFKFACTATTGVVEVRAFTSGEDLDPDGYGVQVGNSQPLRLMPDNAVARFHQVAPGSHNVAINGMTSNCSTGDQPPFQLVQITAGGSIRDTARVQFTVQCTRTDKIALIQDMQVLVVFADGEYPAYVGTGRGSPAWSPDGNRLAWEGYECSYYYYYYDYDYCYNVGLRIGNVGGGITALTSDSTDSDPAWSPDGSTIAFVRGGKLLFVTPEGTEVRFWDLLLTPVADPAWSPDGAWLAYTCVIETGNSDICIINRDGLQQRRLTSEAGADSDPSWSPDGTRIAFTTFRYGPESIAHMASMDGTDVIRLEEGRSPSWSRDGQRLVYEKLNHGLAIIGRDGTGRITLSGTRGGQPAWRP